MEKMCPGLNPPCFDKPKAVSAVITVVKKYVLPDMCVKSILPNRINEISAAKMAMMPIRV